MPEEKRPLCARECLPDVVANGTIPAVRPASIFLLFALVCGFNPVQAQGTATPLSPGDRVLLHLSEGAGLGDSLVVDAEGRIFLPRIGALNLRTVPAQGVAVAVREALASVYRSADATVVPLRRVTVTGEVRKPGVFYLPLEASLRDAVAVAEGVTEIGNPDRLTLVRNGTETQLRHWMTAPEGAQPVVSGDLVFLAREGWLKRNALSAISTLGIVVTTFVALSK